MFSIQKIHSGAMFFTLFLALFYYFNIQATKKTNRLKVSPFASTTKGKPGLITSWVVHEDETIRSLVAFARARQSYIISCGNDAAVTLWSVKGRRIGDFMQVCGFQHWNLCWLCCTIEFFPFVSFCFPFFTIHLISINFWICCWLVFPC